MPEPKSVAGPTTLRAAILDALVYFVLPRDRLLMRAYTATLKHVGKESEEIPATLEETRARYYQAAGIPIPAEPELRAIESRMVLGPRVAASWIVAWTVLMPAMLVGALGATMLLGGRFRSLEDVIVTLVFGLILLPVLAYAGLFAQSLFLLPFQEMMRRLLREPANPAGSGPLRGMSDINDARGGAPPPGHDQTPPPQS